MIRFPRHHFRRQWVIRPSHENALTGWKPWRLTGQFTLWTHPDTRVSDFAGVYVIGTAVTLHDHSPSSSIPFCDWLRYLAGFYVVVRVVGDNIELYTDPAGLSGVYFLHEEAASTPRLLSNVKRNTNLDAHYSLNIHDDWYPGTLCPYEHVQVLPANHCLQFPNGTTKRFWPFDTGKTISEDDAVDEAKALIERSMAQLAEQHQNILISVTGGTDSRVTVAAACGLGLDARYFTLRHPSMSSRHCDVRIPALLAQSGPFPHQFIRVPPPERELVQLYDEATSHMSVGARRDIIGACAEIAPQDGVHISGTLGEICKRYYWPTSKPTSVSPQPLYNAFSQRPECVTQSIDRWFETVPDLPPATVYNLMYLEQRGGRWAGVGETGSLLFYNAFTPFNNRLLFETICRMRPESQNESFLKRLVAAMAPPLGRVPYCHSPMWKRHIPRPLRRLAKTLLRK